MSERRQIIHNLVIHEGSQLNIQVKELACRGTAPSGLQGEIRPRSNTLTPVRSSYWVQVAATHLILYLFLQIKKKSMDKAKQEERMSKEFAAMEEAALKAYQEDLKRMEREAAGSVLGFWMKKVCNLWDTLTLC